jgi:hypothetical protein
MVALDTKPEPVRGSRPDGMSAGTDSTVGAPDVQIPNVQLPMSQQSAFGSHGYDMYPQEFLHLSGCQELSLRREKKQGVLVS